jgi:hypothetical protein
LDINGWRTKRGVRSSTVSLKRPLVPWVPGLHDPALARVVSGVKAPLVRARNFEMTGTQDRLDGQCPGLSLCSTRGAFHWDKHRSIITF